MGEHPNVEGLKKGYAAYKSGDLDALRDLFAPDIIWHAPGNWPLAGDYKGIDEVFGFFGKILETFDSFEQRMIDYFANDERGVAILETSVTVGGKSATSLQAHIFRYEDGKVAEFWNCNYDQASFEELFK